MTTRNLAGDLTLRDSHGYARDITITPEPAGISFTATNHNLGDHVLVHLDTAGLDQLAAEILRIREERGY